MFKILTGKYDSDISNFVTLSDQALNTRGHSLKIAKFRPNTTLRKFSFTTKCTDTWIYNLPDKVIAAPSINSFKNNWTSSGVPFPCFTTMKTTQHLEISPGECKHTITKLYFETWQLKSRQKTRPEGAYMSWIIIGIVFFFKNQWILGQIKQQQNTFLVGFWLRMFIAPVSIYKHIERIAQIEINDATFLLPLEWKNELRMPKMSKVVKHYKKVAHTRYAWKVSFWSSNVILEQLNCKETVKKCKKIFI